MAREKQVETFEQLYTRLEASVQRLEQGGLSLDEAIAAFEEGMKLARACQDRLDAAEQKITKLRESFAPVPHDNSPLVAGGDDIEYVADDELDADDDGTYP